MALTSSEYAKLRRVEKAVRELRAKKNAEAKERGKLVKREIRKAIDRSAAGQRRPRVQEPAYLQWLRRLPCVACGSRERVEAAHVRAGYASAGWRPTGMMEKPDDARAVPLCALCHREGPDAQHRSSERAWWSVRGIDPPDLCAAFRQAYEADQDGEAVVRRFIPRRTA